MPHLLLVLLLLLLLPLLAECQSWSWLSLLARLSPPNSAAL
jgi:hypothetical protein